MAKDAVEPRLRSHLENESRLWLQIAIAEARRDELRKKARDLIARHSPCGSRLRGLQVARAADNPTFSQPEPPHQNSRGLPMTQPKRTRG
jgi:hypothetical protein